MRQSELATRTGRPLKTINEIIKGKTVITPETAIQLERVLGVPAEFWLAREQRYQEWRARQAEDACLLEDVSWLKELPVKEMVRLNWITPETDPVQQMRGCLRFFAVASVPAWREQYQKPLAAFRASQKAEKKVGAVAAWLRKGEIEAERIACRPYDKERFKEVLSKVRTLTLVSDPAVFVPQLTQLCASAGVAVVLVPAPSGCPASGATRWLTTEKALLLLSLRHKTNDHLWFTFFHEAGHIAKHGKKLLFLEDGNDITSAHEQEADRFAGEMLIPSHYSSRFRKLRSHAAVEAFAQEIGIAPGIVVGRLQKEEILPWTHLNALKYRYDWVTPGEPSDDSEGESRA